LDIGIKTFLKVLRNTKWIARWKTQNRHRTWIDKQTNQQTDWRITWNIQHPSRITNNHTSFEDHNNRLFKFKILNQELPTKNKLHQRKPDIYKDSKCHKCQEIETIDHILTHHNQGTKTYNKFIEIAKQQISSRATKKQQKDLKEIIQNTIPYNNKNIILISKNIIFKKL